jgi:hypothetical protein
MYLYDAEAVTAETLRTILIQTLLAAEEGEATPSVGNPLLAAYMGAREDEEDMADLPEDERMVLVKAEELEPKMMAQYVKSFCKRIPGYTPEAAQEGWMWPSGLTYAGGRGYPKDFMLELAAILADKDARMALRMRAWAKASGEAA